MTEDAIQYTGFGAMPEKGSGAPFTVDRPFKGTVKDWTLKSYGLAFVIEHEMLYWDKYGIFKGVTKRLARSGIDKKNQLGYAIFNNATNASAAAEFLTSESQALCSASHALIRTGAGTGKNAPSSAVGLSYLGIQEAITDFLLLENEDGLYAMLDPDVLACHPSKKWIGQTILGSQYRHDTANRELNTLKGELRGPHCSPFFDSTTRWFVLAKKEDLEAAFCIGQDLMFRRDYQVSTWNSTWSMYMSARVDILTWPGFWGTDGA